MPDPRALAAAALARSTRFSCGQCACTWWTAPPPEPWPWPAKSCPRCGWYGCLGEVPNEDVPALAAALTVACDRAEAAAGLLAEVVADPLAGTRPEPGFLTKYECVYCTWSAWIKDDPIPVPVPHAPDCLIGRIAAHLAAHAPAGGVEAAGDG
jgi:hypothetical protein